MHIKQESTKVSLEEALESLKKAMDLLDSSQDESREWQNASEVLDQTASALDDAALAVKGYHELGHQGNQTETEQLSLIQQLADSVASQRKSILKATRTVMTGKWLDDIPEDTLIVWATATGTAEKFAHTLQQELGVEAMSIKDLSMADLQKRNRVYLICSTFGCGRPPRDAEALLTMLQVMSGKNNNKNNVSALHALEFAVAALGNSKFTAFCKFGKDLSELLRNLGATELIPLALMDCKNGKKFQKKKFAEWQANVLKLEGKESDVEQRRSGTRLFGEKMNRRRRTMGKSAASAASGADSASSGCVAF